MNMISRGAFKTEEPGKSGKVMFADQVIRSKDMLAAGEAKASVSEKSEDPMFSVGHNDSSEASAEAELRNRRQTAQFNEQ